MRIDITTVERALAAARERLLAARVSDSADRSLRGYWEGELSGSALSTATSICALAMVDRACGSTQFSTLIDRGFSWLAKHQNADGGWGDTVDSPSNISTTTLCWAALGIDRDLARLHQSVIERAETRLRRDADDLTPSGLAGAICSVYGKDRTFSTPILAMCALAGRFGADRDAWRHVPALPFELAACPHAWLRRLGLPVVSYALPALIAIGQARHFHRPTWNPVTRCLRNLTRKSTLRVLESIQPSSGGFLEAAPLTGFVTMSLVSIGLADHPVVTNAVEFLISTVSRDGSWPIDTNLATWVTTLSIKALTTDDGAEASTRQTTNHPTGLSDEERANLRGWLLGQQYKEEHPYTHAAPGGWAWTDLSGGVPDADDTAGALLALYYLADPNDRAQDVRAQDDRAQSDAAPGGMGKQELASGRSSATPCGWRRTGDDWRFAAHKGRRYTPNTYTNTFAHTARAASAGVRWLLDLQNRDGGIPTFCRGWGKLPFDRSSPDLTAHALLAWRAWRQHLDTGLDRRIRHASDRAIRYLIKAQCPDGSWVPLWFGNQYAPRRENPLYGTTRVLRAGLITPEDAPARAAWAAAMQSGLCWLLEAQNADGGWGGAPSVASSIEETGMALEALAEVAGGFRQQNELSRSVADLPSGQVLAAIGRGVTWLVDGTEYGTCFEPAPIGLYFAKLWYFERLYPLIFTVSALRRVCETLKVDQACATALEQCWNAVNEEPHSKDARKLE